MEEVLLYFVLYRNKHILYLKRVKKDGEACLYGEIILHDSLLIMVIRTSLISIVRVLATFQLLIIHILANKHILYQLHSFYSDDFLLWEHNENVSETVGQIFHIWHYECLGLRHDACIF